MSEWTIQQARRVYNVSHWSGGYFDISDGGNVVARPGGPESATQIDLLQLTQELLSQGLNAPVLVRFSNILHHRIDTLCGAFQTAMEAFEYRGSYTAVYPIKVNQQSSVVNEILRYGQSRVGLEAGSKPELLAVLGCSHPGGIIVCNGYKDREYIRLALIGRRIGHRVYIVVEKLSELEIVIRESRALGIDPLVGIRVRLASIGAGKWQNTGGEKSKFGLSAAEVLRTIERLSEAGMLDALQMMHFHMGSQIANIRHIQEGMREAARYYAELRGLGAPVAVINVGGGLGVDYEGSRSRSFCSMNYTVQEYANNIVHGLGEICVANELPFPEIISESGRALAAHHAVLITNVIDVEKIDHGVVPPAENDEPQVIRDLWEGLQNLSNRSVLEVYHDAVYRLSEVQQMFNHGVLTLAQRARAEQIFVATCRGVRDGLQPGTKAHREILDELNERLADKYFCNFSLFQSIPDAWAIDQIFPVAPLHNLERRPDRRGVVEDITCDSDGRIDFYVDGEGVEASLPLHLYRAGEPYYVGIFLVGAYQEILGDMHNLFGDTDSVNVELTTDGGYRAVLPLRGDTVDAVLRYVRFNPDDLREAYRIKVEAASEIEPPVKAEYLLELEAGLDGYTYLED